MNPCFVSFFRIAIVASIAGNLMAGEVVLKASKDNFGRSNEQNKNNGASDRLFIAHTPHIRAIVAFDLSVVTNKITGAELRLRQHESVKTPVSMVVAPMVQTKNNAAWGEGAGNMGAIGQNARLGESCYIRSAFRDIPWESSSGQPLENLGNSKLWNAPAGTRQDISWEEDGWVKVKLGNAAALEKIRESDITVATFGFWGTSGNGLYAISSKESGHAPQLVLAVEDAEAGSGK